MPLRKNIILSKACIFTNDNTEQINVSPLKWWILLALIISLEILMIYRTGAGEIYVQDDWHILNQTISNDAANYISTEFDPTGKLFFRPLGHAFMSVSVLAFGPDFPLFPYLHRIILLGSTLLLAAIALTLGFNRTTAFLSSMLYAGLTVVHIAPLHWMVGIYDIAGNFLFLLTIFLALKEKFLMSALILCLSIGFKEGTIFAPGLIAFILFFEVKHSKSTVKSAAMKFLPFVVIMLAYLYIKSMGLNAMHLPLDHPYRLDLFGKHIIMNILRYATWITQAFITPFDIAIPETKKALPYAITIIVLALSGLAYLAYKRGTLKTSNSEKTLFLSLWVILGILPVLFLPNHAFRYYMIFSASAMSLLIADIIIGFISNTKHACKLVLIFASLFILFAVFHANYKQHKDCQQQIGLNQILTCSQKTVKKCREIVYDHKEKLETKKQILADNVFIRAMYDNAAFEVWLNRPINVYQINNLELTGKTLRAFVHEPLNQQDGAWEIFTSDETAVLKGYVHDTKANTLPFPSLYADKIGISFFE